DAPRPGSDRRLRRHGRLHPRRRSLARILADLGAAAVSDVLLVERDEPIAVCLLNRPKQLNALSDELMDELVTALRELDADEAIRCIVLGGSERAFAAGADIGELAQSTAIELHDAREALASGLVARVVAKEAWLDEAKRVAREIATKGPVATRLAKEAVDRAHETTLGLGLEYERRALYLAFASEDAKEGLEAFV